MIILGQMSGTSLDGLDLALCEFGKQEEQYLFRIISAQTVDYGPAWTKALSSLNGSLAQGYFKWHSLYGSFVAEKVNEFLSATGARPVAIASHGHTVFHQPALGFSTQLGCGATIAAKTGITTVCDFRSMDVALGGQGAPLVPIGDQYLFAKYDACLNLGGIANISFGNGQGQRLAYDVCEANMLLNHLAQKAGQAYDKNGDMAKAGTVDQELLAALNRQDFYQQSGARSLGREWFDKTVLPLLKAPGKTTEDLLATATEHIAQVLSQEINRLPLKHVLVTGGGAFNEFLMEKLRTAIKAELVIPDLLTVNFKEALIFAFLGYLRLQGKTNTLKSVTGAVSNSIGGAVYLR
jgi:anhydro-N-acetylmuramic acid kinase